jgi:hypothetical protein
VPHEQHTDLSDAADISSSYLPMEDRISVEEISGGNSREAISRSMNSSFSKSTAKLRASKPLASSAPLGSLALGHIDGYVDEDGFFLSLVTLRFLVLGCIGGFADKGDFSFIV